MYLKLMRENDEKNGEKKRLLVEEKKKDHLANLKYIKLLEEREQERVRELNRREGIVLSRIK